MRVDARLKRVEKATPSAKKSGRNMPVLFIDESESEKEAIDRYREETGYDGDADNIWIVEFVSPDNGGVDATE